MHEIKAKIKDQMHGLQTNMKTPKMRTNMTTSKEVTNTQNH